MNKIERVDRITSLLKAAGGAISSRKKLHKLVYLLQQAGERFDQDFKFHHYGVYSPTLSYDLEYAEDNGVIVQEFVEDRGYTIALSESISHSQVPEFTPSVKNQSLMRALLPLPPQLLEAVSTIVYLHGNYYSGPDLKRKFDELKPALKDQFSRAAKLAKDHYKV